MEYFAIGLMSGTSLDGLDICYAKFTKQENWTFEILEAETFPYEEAWENQLKNSIHLSAENLYELHSHYGFLLGEFTQKFIETHQIKKIDIIASHGHTVFHQPAKKYTVQIGDGRAIKKITQQKIVFDFRSQDVVMGGNGAPLVPVGDEFLFHEYDTCINLGGFSNISFKNNNQRLAFDISPVNIILNVFAKKLGKNYDENGDFARRGNIDIELLEKLNSLDFYQQKAPKSLGVEWCIKNIFPLLENHPSETILATFTEHIAEQIAKVFNENHLKKALFTGGGTYNTFLLEKIVTKTSTEIIIPDQKIIEFKEALIFAFMGVLKLRNENNVLSSATGSSEDHCSGLLV